MEPEHREGTLSWERRPFAELARIGWPIAVSMLSYSVMTLVDTLFVGRLGAEALAGVGLAGTMVFVLLCFPFGLLRGTRILVSQAVGAGRREQVARYLGAGLWLAFGLGAVLLVLGALAAPSLAALSADPEAAQAAVGYFRVRALGVPVALVYVALREARYGVGDSRSPMLASVAANGLNIALDYLFIFKLELGVEGAAWATNVAVCLEAAVMVAVQRVEGFGLARARLPHLLAALRLGVPTGLQFALEVGAFAMLAAMISRYGAVEMAAHQIALQIIHFSFLPGFALADAASVLTGQAVGAGRERLVRRVAHLALVGVLIYMGACAAILLGWGELLARGFSEDPALVAVAVRLLVVAALFQLFDGAYMVARGALRGAGDVRVPAAVGVACSWLCTPPLMWLLGYQLELGALGGWVGLCAELVVGAAILWWRLERGHWRAAAARTRAEREAAEGELALAEGARAVEV